MNTDFADQKMIKSKINGFLCTLAALRKMFLLLPQSRQGAENLGKKVDKIRF
jgi:hypothetical protein